MTTQWTDEQRTLLPTDDDIAAYREHGYYKSGKIFTDEELDNVVAATERFYAGETENVFGLPFKESFKEKFVPKPGKEYPANKMRKSDFSSYQNRTLANLVRNPLMGAIAARLAGDDVRLWHDQLLYKPVEEPGKPVNVGWHTDRGYWKTCTSTNLLTAWIPFHDCDEKMGTIMMIDGSLHWPDNTSGLDFFSNDLEGLEARFQTGGKPVVKIPMNLKKGEVSFHHCLTIHGSGPNRGTLPRRSIAVHMQDAANRFQTYTFPDGRVANHDNDNFGHRDERGLPDYTDPDFFPVLGRL